MKFPKKYIKRGNFKLHSGKRTKIFYDVCAMITEPKYMSMIINDTPPDCITYVGIATGGAIISSWNHHLRNFAMIKDGEVKGKIEGSYCLIDDVVTTEKSLRDAIKLIGRKPKRIFCVMDRRDERKITLPIKSMFQEDG